MEKLRILMFLVILTFCDAKSAEVVKLEPECAKGVTFWCQDIINAKKCRSVDFCIKSVWTTHVAVQDGDSVCQSCKTAIDNARKFLKDKDVEHEIDTDLRMVCDTIPVPVLPLACKKVVDESIPEILSLLSTAMDSNAICSTILFCNNVEYDNALAEPTIGVHQVSVDSAVQLNVQPISEKPSCPFCLMALQEITEIIKSNRTKKSIESALGNLCSRLKDNLIGQCTEFVKDYTREVVDMLLANFTPQDACTFIRLCSDKPTKFQNANIVMLSADFEDSDDKVLNNPQCELCKNIVEIVEQHVVDKNSKAEIRHALEKSCDKIKKFSAKCKKFVDEFSDRIVDLIEKELEPEEVCKNLMFCVISGDVESQDYDSGLEVFSLAVKEPAEEIKVQPKCVICEFVMAQFVKEISDDSTDAQIKHALKNICTKMPNTISKTCNQYIDFYFDMMIALLKTEKPANVCTAMKLCSKGNDQEVIEMIRNDLFSCAICKGVVTSVGMVVEDPTIDLQIVDVEEKLCMKMLGRFNKMCHYIIQKYGQLIVNLLKNMTESDQVCYKLNLCSQGSVTGMLKLTD